MSERRGRLERRFEAVIIDWDETAICDRPADASRLRALVEELCALGMEIAVVSGKSLEDVDGSLLARPGGPGSLHLLVSRGSGAFKVGAEGPARVWRRAPGAHHSAHWMLADLWERGIGPAQTLIAGDELSRLRVVPESAAGLLVPEADRATWTGGGAESLLTLLDDQLARRRQGDVPELDGDPSWTLAIEGVDRKRERAHESLLTLADGRIGTRGTPICEQPDAAPLVVAAGVYRGSGAEAELRAGPEWNRLSFAPGARPVRRELDLHSGLMRQEVATPDGSVQALLFSSLARPGTTLLRCTGPEAAWRDGEALRPPTAGLEADCESGHHRGRHWMWAGDRAGALAAAAAEDAAGDGRISRLDRVAVYRVGRDGPSARVAALADLDAARAVGSEGLLAEHRAAWARRWSEADVEIEGDPELQLAARMAMFHLMASALDEGEAAVGARGLTGPAYRGHVFWDADVFVLPFLAATHPEAARAMLEYRLRRLPAAIAAARTLGRAGARVPWESAATGDDVTPGSAVDRAGRQIVIHTGRLEEHIVADVAWGAGCYLDWTADEAFLATSGARLLTETARYWASRIEVDGSGRGHIRGVIGPDEYHVGVDDNAYTNVMARWNLRRAAGIDPAYADEVSENERRDWLERADALVDGFDPTSRLYEQFAGFHELEPLVVADLATRRPVAADLLLGPERVSSSQVIKQADVLMLHHLVPDEVAPGSLGANLDFYEPRTAHASSLSPGVHATLMARAGRLDAALDALRLTARIDRDDLSETTAGGLHLAAMGTVWQTLAWGFAGVRPDRDALRVDPRLPPEWKSLRLRLRFRGTRIRLEVRRDGIRVATDRPIKLAVGSQGEPISLDEGTAHFDAGAISAEAHP